MSNHTPTIHEFSTGIYIELLPGNRWRSKGFTGGWNNNTFGTTYGQVAIPAALDAAIRNKQFEVRAPEQEAAVVGRVVQRQGDPEIWAVVAVVSNAVDNRARGLPVWRYFCCACTDLTNANLELIRLLGRLDAFNAKYGRLPVFDPQTLSGKQSNLAQIYPANRPLSEPKSAEYQDALNATNTVILPLVLDARTCHSYYQLLSLASTIASVQNRFISWAWNVSEVEQPGAFVAIQMAVGYTLRMRQAAAPAAAIAAGSDVAALAAVLQEFGRDQQVKAETVQKLDDLLQQDPGLKDPEILRQTYRQFGIEANKKDLKIFRLEQLVNPQQIRALTLWPLLDSQMLPEYQRWCGLFPGNTKQGQISSDFHELKRLLPQFPSLDMVVGKEVESQWWSLFTNIKISGPEFARQLIDPNSLFASGVVCQTSGERMTKVEKELQQVRQRQVLAQNSELDQQNYYWSDLKTYCQVWSAQDAPSLAASGIYHPLFVPQGSGGQGGVNLSSQGWKSWFNIVEGLLKAISVFRSLMNVQQILNGLPSPNHCYQKYSELLTFLDLLCRKPQYEPYFQPLNQFLKKALQPARISVSESDLWLKAIGYVIKPILGLIALETVIILIIYFVHTALIPLLNFVVALVFVIVVILFVIVVIASIWPEMMTRLQSGLFLGSSGLFSEGLRSRTEALLNILRSLPDSNEKGQWNSFLKKYTGFLTDVLALDKIGHIKRNEHLRDIAQCIDTEIEDCKKEVTEAVGKQAWETVESKHRVLVRLQCFAVWTLTLDPSHTPINPVDDFLTELAKKNVWNLDKLIPKQADLVEDLNQITVNEIVNFSAQLRQSLANEDKGSRCLSKLERYLTAHLFKGLRITPDIFLQWVGSDKFIPHEALLKVLQDDRNLYLDVNYCHHSRIWNPLCIRYNPQASMSSDDISKRGYGLIEQVLLHLSQETSQDTLVSDKLSALAEVFNQVCTIPSSAVYETLRRIVTKKVWSNQYSTTQYEEQDLAQKLETALSNLPSVPLVSPVSPKRSSVGTPSTKTQPPTQAIPKVPTQAQTSNRKGRWKIPVFVFVLIILLGGLFLFARSSGLVGRQPPSSAPIETNPPRGVSLGKFFGSFIPDFPKLGNNPTPEPPPPASTSPNRETFLKIKEDLRIPTDGSDDATLAKKIAQQLGETTIEADANTTPIQGSLLELWSNPDSWSQDNQDVLSEGVKALQTISGLPETGTLTPEAPLYRLIKRRTSRDVAIAAYEANPPALPDKPNVERRRKTVAGLQILDDIAKKCKSEMNKKQLIDALKKELTGNPDRDALDWFRITQYERHSFQIFETAIVLYKYPIESTSTDPQPTLIKGQDDPDLYDLELGIRQQIKCWDGLSDPPPEG